MCCLVLRSSCVLLLTIQFASLFFLFFFFIFFRQDFVQAISLEPLLSETPNLVCCLVLRSSCALLLTIQFTLLFFFSATILSRAYLWNHYSQRLQIESAAWSCGLILHCCLPSNSLCYIFFFATILSGLEFFIFGGSLLGRIQGDREPVSFSFTLKLFLFCFYFLFTFFLFPSLYFVFFYFYFPLFSAFSYLLSFRWDFVLVRVKQAVRFLQSFLL